MTYDKTNSGALFKNGKKTKESQPDYLGPLNVNGVDLRIAAWIKHDKDGIPYMGLAVSEKQEDRPAKASPVPQPFDDDVPF